MGVRKGQVSLVGVTSFVSFDKLRTNAGASTGLGDETGKLGRP